MLADFAHQSSGTSYSMPSSVEAGKTSQVPSGKQRSSVISAWTTQLRKRKKRKKKELNDVFGIHHYPDKKQTNISYSYEGKGDRNPGWRRRYERYGLSKASSDNRDRSELTDYIGHYTINR